MNRDEAGERRGGRIIGKVLPAAVRLWLRSQAEQVENLSVELSGRDRDILSGYLPGVSLGAEQAIYQGIHIGELNLSAADIRINVGQVVRGKPLRLLKAFPVLGQVVLTEDNVNESLSSPLLAQGLNEFWRSLIQQPTTASSIESRYGSLPISPMVVLDAAEVRLARGRLGLRFYPCAEGARAEQPVIFSAELVVMNGNYLQLRAPLWIEDLADLHTGEVIEPLQNFRWDLGSDAQIEHLLIQSNQMMLKGQIMVNP